MDYSVSQNYNLRIESIPFGLKICSTAVSGQTCESAGTVYGTIVIPTIPTAETRGSVTFTSTDSTVYLVVNGGDIADSQSVSFTMGNLKLEKGGIATEWTTPVNNVYVETGPRPGYGVSFGTSATHEAFNIAMSPECYGERWVPYFVTSNISTFVPPLGVHECLILDTSTKRL